MIRKMNAKGLGYCSDSLLKRLKSSGATSDVKSPSRKSKSCTELEIPDFAYILKTRLLFGRLKKL